MKRVGRERGQAIVWIVVFLPLFLSVIGLAIDGGVVLDQQQALQLLANSAARTGAEQLDQQSYYDSGGSVLVVDPTAARVAALRYVDLQATDVTAAVAIDRQSVMVQLQRTANFAFLPIIGLDHVQLHATGTARIAHTGS